MYNIISEPSQYNIGGFIKTLSSVFGPSFSLLDDMILNTLLSRDLLIDAYKFYKRGDARAHDALNIIIKRDDMLSAVKGCLDQAVKEEEPTKQQLYIQAACFGKKFYPGIAIEEFQTACRLLRVMNILRRELIEPDSSVEAAVDLLVARKQFERALWIVQYLKFGSEHQIRVKWSEHLIEQRQLSDDKVAEKIQAILGQDSQVSYTDIANKAIELQRVQLAIKLLDKDSHSPEQIPLLLNLKQYDRVLAHALSSCNSNLIYMAIFKLRESIPSDIPFFELLKKHRLALRYYCNYLSATDIKTLIMICHKNNSDDELLWSFIDNRLESALAVAKKTRKDVIPQQIEQSIKLNKFQQGLNLAPPPLSKRSSWIGLSVSDTIINLIALEQTSKAKDVQKKFEVSDKKYRVLEQIANNNLPKLVIQAVQS
uniref:Vacuolar protein sorting-associated protein 16 n=1 Tax=Aceria tosichella TaxID=561515 RepID=A0A6G1SIQ7_9ACAR